MMTPAEALFRQEALTESQQAQQFYQQQFTKEKADRLKYLGIMAQTLGEDQAQGAAPSIPAPAPPPPMTPPNAMAPGAPSTPMQPPGYQGPPMGAMGGMSQMPPQGALPPPPPPSPAMARPAVGMGGNPNLGVNANFQGARPQDVAAVLRDIKQQSAAQPKPQPQPDSWKTPMSTIMGQEQAPDQGAPSVGEPPKPPEQQIVERVAPGKLLSPAQFIQKAIKRGVSFEDAGAALEMYKPYYDAQQRDEFKMIQAELAATKAANEAYKASIQASRAGTYEKDVERKGTQGEERLRQGQEKIDLQRDAAERKVSESNAVEGLTPAGMKAAEDLVRAGRPLPGGWGAKNQSRGNAILNQMGKEMEGGAEPASKQIQDYRATSTALTAVTKDLAAIRPYKTMLDTNADIAIKLADKAIATNSQFANKPLNWLRQNVGDNPDVAEYLAQIRIVSTEAARVLNNPRLVGQLTDSARHEMEDIVNGNMPFNATKRVLERMKQDGANRVKAMEREQDSLREGGGAARSEARDFKTVEDAEKANLPKGTKITVNGRPATVQ